MMFGNGMEAAPQNSRRLEAGLQRAARAASAFGGHTKAELHHNGVMIAGPVACGTMHHLAIDDFDRVVGQDVVDADARVLVEADEVRRNGIAPSCLRDCVLQTKLAQGTEDFLPALDKSPQYGF